jgi:thiosulfate/3-mercaptopyruvate sulfurtransferase
VAELFSRLNSSKEAFSMREPNALISTDALARDLSRGDLRVFDCTTYLEPPPPGSDEPYIAVPGRSSFETAHIPGADFLDLQGEFSDNTTGFAS